jgi:hypothetical protein
VQKQFPFFNSVPHLHRCRGRHLSAGGRIWRAGCWSPVHCSPHLHRCRGQHLSAGGRIWRAGCWSPVHAPLLVLSPAGQKMFSLRQDFTSLHNNLEIHKQNNFFIFEIPHFFKHKRTGDFLLLNAYFCKSRSQPSQDFSFSSKIAFGQRLV